MTSQTNTHPKKINSRFAYVGLVSLIGILIIGWAVFRLPNTVDPVILLGLIVLNAVAQFSVISTQHRGISFGVSQAVNLAAVALLGIESGVIVAALAGTSISIIRTVHKDGPWKGSLEQLFFNTGMETIAIFVAGSAFLVLRDALATQSVLLKAVPWLIAALLFEQTNMWILSGIIYIQRHINPFKFLRSNAWAMPINITIGMVGGYLLTQSIVALNWQGILLFVFPLMLSAYSLRMYVKETDKQMDVVLDRTSQLTEANTRLQQLAEERDRLLAVLSHDMRTSLSALQASAELLQTQNDNIDEERRERLYNVIRKSGSSLTSMVDNLVNIEQTNHKPASLSIDAFDISDSVRMVVESLDSLASEKQITIQYDMDDVPIIMSADKQMLRHVVLNLVSNAIKYTPDHGTVTVAVHAQPHCVLLAVQDTGIGIPSQEMSRIFEPYYRIAEHTAQAEGTGLGLAIVKRFVEAHDGSIDVSSKPSVGTRFLVRLPYRKREEPTASSLETAMPVLA